MVTYNTLKVSGPLSIVYTFYVYFIVLFIGCINFNIYKKPQL